MGRSVETIGSNVVHFDCSNYGYEDEEYFEDMAQDEWKCTVDNIQAALSKRYKSLVSVEKWAEYPCRENQIILENYHVQVSISEYCGCGAVSVFVNPCCEYPELAEAWLAKAWPGISRLISENVAALVKVATFSNGEAVFEKMKS